MNRTCLAAIALTAGLSLTGCGNDMQDLRDYVEEVKSRKSADIEPIPQIRPYEPFTYRPQDRRSPFAPLAKKDAGPQRSTSDVAPDFNRNPEPLEEFPLDSLRMAGTMRVAGRDYALIKAPDNIVHRVTTGDHMGQNYGEIVAINETEVKLIEIVPDGLGGFMKRPASIALSE